eukprot:3285777-Pleurochrysis_carterae.AAC.1
MHPRSTYAHAPEHADTCAEGQAKFWSRVWACVRVHVAWSRARAWACVHASESENKGAHSGRAGRRVGG